jgi:signal peptidase II
MPVSTAPAWRRPAAWFLVTSMLAGGCDLSTKTWAQQALGHVGGSRTVIDPWLELSLAYNRGTAFSVIPHLGDLRWLFALLALVVVGVLMGVALRWRPFRVAPVLALGIAAGGAIGNGWDRAFRVTPAGDTAVIDFIKVNLTSTYSWPTFNLADAWLVVGVAWMLWIGWRSKDEPDQVAPPSAGEPAAASG